MTNEELVSLYQTTGRGFDELLLKNSGVIRRLFSTFTSDPNEIEDYFQEGCISLEKAAREFKTELGFRFSTFAWTIIRNRFLSLKGKKEKTVQTVSILKKDFAAKTSDPWQTGDLSAAINLLPGYQRNSVMKVYFSNKFNRSDLVIAKRAMPNLKRLLSEKRLEFDVLSERKKLKKKKT
jgi:RNA polymerase sigma factor (sigma-70 family)